MTRISRSRIDMEDGRIDKAAFKDYGETLVGGASGTNTGSSYTIDLSQGNVFNLNLTGNCAFTFSNPKGSGTESSFTLILKQTGNFSPTWPSAVVWPSGTAPTLDILNNYVYIFSFFTMNGGLKWFGSTGGTAYDLNPAQELWAWGAASYGNLGLNSISLNRSSPAQVGTLTTWGSASAAGYHSLAVKTDGTLWAWGSGAQGILGDNTTVGRSSPIQVGTLTDWSSVAAGGLTGVGSGGRAFSLGLKADGTLWAWGDNVQGNLGLDNIVDRSSPTQVGTLSTWDDVAAGAIYTAAAVRTDGTLWTWGQGNNGRLGHSDTVNRSSPAQVGTLTNWSLTSAGAYGVAAVKTDGTLWTWGRNNYGLLGHNTAPSAHISSPVQVGTLTNWASASVSFEHAVAVKTDGTLWTWGNGGTGRLGLDDTATRSSPTQVGTLTNWSSVSAAYSQTAAVKSDGTLWTWGVGTEGVIGDNTTVNRSSPTQVGTLTNWTSIALGQTHALGIKTP